MMELKPYPMQIHITSHFDFFLRRNNGLTNLRVIETRANPDTIGRSAIILNDRERLERWMVLRDKRPAGMDHILTFGSPIFERPCNTYLKTEPYIRDEDLSFMVSTLDNPFPLRQIAALMRFETAVMRSTKPELFPSETISNLNDFLEMRVRPELFQFETN